MNPVKKLVHRIQGSLKHPTDEATLQGLAREYTRVCEEVNRRLEQCSEMLRRQNEYQALELAEATPAVLDLVTLLSFEESDKWRALCHCQKLSIPESLDEKAIRQLNELYAKGINANHPLYKQYRETMLGRDFSGALQVLRSINKLNPKDRNARQELERLENKVLEQKLQTLQEPLDCGIQDALHAIITEIEEIPWTNAPRGPLWEAAKAEQKRSGDRLALVEAGRLIHQMDHARAIEDWATVQDLLYTFQSRKQENETALPADLLERAQVLQSWSQTRKEQADRETAFRQWLLAWETKRSRLGGLSSLELQRLQAEVKPWLAEPEPDLPPPEADFLAEAAAAQTLLLREEQKRRTRRFYLRAAVAAVFSVVLLAAGVVFWGHSRIDNALSDVNLALEEGNITSAQNRLDQLQQLQTWVPGAHSADTGEFEKLRAHIAEAHQLREQFLLALKPMEDLARSGFAGKAFRDVGRTYEQYNLLRTQLPIEFREEFQDRSGLVDAAWNRFLDQARQSSISRLQTLITQSEELLKQKIDFKNDLSRVREGMKPLGKNVSEMEELLSPVMIGLRLPSEQIEKARKITLEAKPFQDALQSLDETGTKMRAAPSLDAYLQAAKTMADSPFTSARETESARNLIQRNLTLNRLGSSLLAPKFVNPPFPLQRISISALFPADEPSEKERTVFLDLRDDPNLGEIYRCRIVGNEANSRWKGETWVFARGEPKNKESRISGEILRSEWKADVYDPAAHPESAGFDSITLLYSYTSKPPAGTRIEEQVLSVESDFFRRIGITDLVDPASGNYRQPILKVLDTLRSDPTLNPLFGAYVFSRLVTLASERSDTWGLSLSPSLQRDDLEVQKVFTSEPFSSDWMVPRRVQTTSARLKKIFDTDRQVSYLAEATLMKEYLQKVNKAGFHFAGFVDETNTLQGNAESKTALELWGWDDKDFIPTLLYQRTSAKDTWKCLRPAAMLSPVFACPINREAVWNEVVAEQKVDAQAPILNEYRPPFSRRDYER